MKLIIKYIRNLILFIWQLPQHIVAFIYFGYLVMMCKDLGIDSRYKQAIVIPCVMIGAITLGFLYNSTLGWSISLYSLCSMLYYFVILNIRKGKDEENKGNI